MASCVPRGAPIAPSAAAPDAPVAPDIQVITNEQAVSAGLEASEAKMTFDGGEDGTEMLEKWLAVARARGVLRVGDLSVFIVGQRGAERIECVTKFYPQDTLVPTFVAGERRLVSVTRPVTRTVTRYQQRCHNVTKPVMHTETRYESQYDSFTKSYRSVPRTYTTTRYESKLECRSEPVTTTETRWEYGLETRYEPPRTEWLVAKRLRQSEPACYEAPDGAKTRVEGTLYRPPAER